MKPSKRKIYQFLTGLTLGGLACLGVQQVDENLHVSVSWGVPVEYAGLIRQEVASHAAPLPSFILPSQKSYDQAQYNQMLAGLAENIDEGR